MKQKFALKAAVLALGTVFFMNNSQAQAPVAQTSTVTTTKQVTVYLDLRNVVEFVVNVNQATLIFDTYAKYNSGTDTTIADQFTISSNKPYDFYVKADGATFVGSNATIPAADVDVTITAGDGTPSAAHPLAVSNGNAINSNVPVGLNRNFSVKYHATGGNDFLVPADIYTQTLTYTVAQQ